MKFRVKKGEENLLFKILGFLQRLKEKGRRKLNLWHFFLIIGSSTRYFDVLPVKLLFVVSPDGCSFLHDNSVSE